MSYMSLEAYYKVSFNLHRRHHYSLTEIEDMMPWERDIYVDMVLEAIKEEREAQSR